MVVHVNFVPSTVGGGCFAAIPAEIEERCRHIILFCLSYSMHGSWLLTGIEGSLCGLWVQADGPPRRRLGPQGRDVTVLSDAHMRNEDQDRRQRQHVHKPFFILFDELSAAKCVDLFSSGVLWHC